MKSKWLKKSVALVMVATVLGSMVSCGKKESTKSETVVKDAKEMVYEESEFVIEGVEGEIMDISVQNEKMYLTTYQIPELDLSSFKNMDESGEESDASEEDTTAEDETATEDDAAAEGDTTATDESKESEEEIDIEDLSEEELEAYAEMIQEMTVTKLYSAKIDGTEVREIPYPELENNQMMNSMTVAKDGSMVFFMSGYDMATETSSYQIIKTDSQGKEIIREDITKLLKETDESYVSDMMLDEKGRIVVVMSDSVSIIDESLKSVEEVKPEGEAFLQGAAMTKDGKIVCAVSYWTEETSTTKLQVLDVDNKKWGEGYEIDVEYISAMMNGLEYDVYYTDDSGIYGYNIADKKSVKLMDYVASNITSEKSYGIMPLAKDQFIGTTYNEEGKTTLSVYNKVDPSKIADKTVIRIGTSWVDDAIKRQAITFNKSNREYQIEFVEYGEEMDPVAKLNADIAAGNVPDIFCFSEMPYEQYIAKGMFEDLTPYLEKDEEIQTEDLIPAVYEAMKSEDGKLYYLATSFGISTLVGRTSDVGKERGWTFDDLKALLEKKGDSARPFYSEDKIGILYSLLSNGLNDFVDWNTGECKFDSQDFKDILEICNKGTTEEMEYDEDGPSMPSLIKEGKILFVDGWISFNELQIYPQMYGEDITYIGYPSEDKSGSYFQFNNQMAIYTKSEVKEGAWEFLRTLMTKEFQGNQNNIYDSPTRQDCMDMLIKAKMATEPYTDELGQEVTPSSGSSWGWDDFEVEIKPSTQEEVDTYLNLINNTKKVATSDDSMFKIIEEETKAYFAGQKSLDETVKIIQNRITTYVNENR